jgi:hypothetical protein
MAIRHWKSLVLHTQIELDVALNELEAAGCTIFSVMSGPIETNPSGYNKVAWTVIYHMEVL